MKFFDCRADAVAFVGGDPPALLRYATDYGDWSGKKVSVAPAHENIVTIADGTIYERNFATVAQPASVTELGLLPDQGPGVDMTPALNKVIAAHAANNCSDWVFPKGVFYFNSLPNDIVTSGLTLRGLGKTNTTLHKNFPSDNYHGVFNVRGAHAVEFHDFAMYADMASQDAIQGGMGCHITYQSVFRSGLPVGCSYGALNGVLMTSLSPAGQAYLRQDLLLDGSPTGNIYYGVRTFNINDCNFFGAEACSIAAISCGSFTMVNSWTAEAGGKSARVLITGTPAARSANAYIQSSAISNGLEFDYCDGAYAEAAVFQGGVVKFGAQAVECHARGSLKYGATVANYAPPAANNTYNQL